MDLTKALAPKSDQLDFADLEGSAPQVFTITDVSENGSELADQQPVNIRSPSSPACGDQARGCCASSPTTGARTSRSGSVAGRAVRRPRGLLRQGEARRHAHQPPVAHLQPQDDARQPARRKGRLLDRMSTDQLALDLAEITEPDYEQDATIQERWEMWRDANPWVLTTLARLLDEWSASGGRKVGVKCAVEWLRWHYQRFEATDAGRIEKVRAEFKWNNSFSSRAARDLIAAYPHLAGVIETRELRAS
jgi:hypothetical protein